MILNVSEFYLAGRYSNTSSNGRTIATTTNAIQTSIHALTNSFATAIATVFVSVCAISNRVIVHSLQALFVELPVDSYNNCQLLVRNIHPLNTKKNVSLDTNKSAFLNFIHNHTTNLKKNSNIILPIKISKLSSILAKSTIQI